MTAYGEELSLHRCPTNSLSARDAAKDVRPFYVVVLSFCFSLLLSLPRPTARAERERAKKGQCRAHGLGEKKARARRDPLQHDTLRVWTEPLGYPPQ